MDTPFTLPGRLALSEEVAVKRNSNQLDCLIMVAPDRVLKAVTIFLFVFIQYLKRDTQLATIASLPCGSL